MSQDGPEPGSLLDELLRALGGAERIGSVRSFARESSLAWFPGRLPPLSERLDPPAGAEPPSLTFAFLQECDAAEAPGRETLFRAVPGRARLEIEVPAKSGHPQRRVRVGGEVLRDARREPRNLLAHARERGAEGRAAPDGGIEVVVPAEGLFYRFDPATLLCAGRTHIGGGASTLYREWRRVDGVATPFLEIELHPFGRLERRVRAVAYDLDWPEGLFRSVPD